MNMKECYVDAIEWLSKHKRNGIIIRVKNDKELKQYRKYFKEQVANDLFLEEEMFSRIEWRIDPTAR